MKGLTIGYIRVSSEDQNPDRQLADIRINVDKIFIDKVSGKTIERPQLQAMMEFAREGDTIIVHSLDRLARNLDHLRYTVKYLTDKKIKVHFIKENLIFSGDDSPMANLMLSVMGAFAEFERSIIRERQKEGIAIAKANKLYTGRKKCLSAQQVVEIKQKIANGVSKTKIAKEFNINRTTIYKYLAQMP